MRAAPGWLAKGGAEGLLCAAGPDGIGVALKTEDGASRAARAGARGVLRRVSASTYRILQSRRSLNTRGEHVGEIVTAS